MTTPIFFMPKPPTTSEPVAEPIDHSLLVSDINRHFPQCRPVFEKYGIAGCGGDFGPPEPLFIFAAAHRVPLGALVDELNQAVRGEWKEERREKSEESNELESEHLYKHFVFAALVMAVTAGFALGAINLTRIAFGQSYAEISGVLKQIHGHAQLFGWAGLFIMGVAFHAVPRFKMAPLQPLWMARACLPLMFGGVILRTLSQPWGNTVAGRYGVLASGGLEFVAIVFFVRLISGVVLRSEQAVEHYDKFIWASVFWFAVLGAWNFWIVAGMFANRSVGIPALPNLLFIHVAFFGFIANMIFGFSLRVLPHFLGLRATRVRAATIAFALWNVAICLRYPVEGLAWVAASLEVAAAVLLVWSLGIFARRRVRIDIKGVDPTFAWFIYLGFAWLLITAALPFHADIFRLSPAARHAMAIGFVTSVILGVGQRVLPIFNGVNLWSNKLMRATFWTWALGTTLPIAMALNTAYGWTWTYVWSGVAGWLTFLALAMFAWNLTATLRVTAEKFTRESFVTAQTRVTELLEVRPELRPVLIHGGLGGLAAMRHNPPRFVTIEFAARRHDIDPQPLIAALNKEIQGSRTA